MHVEPNAVESFQEHRRDETENGRLHVLLGEFLTENEELRFQVAFLERETRSINGKTLEELQRVQPAPAIRKEA